MNRIALYRAWRPQTFQDVVGQQHITRTLSNSLKESKVSHAYLFSGPRGTGKTSTAKILARAVNCEKGLEDAPCNQCSSCERINAGAVMDVIEIDAASNRGVDEIRDIRDKVKYAPTEVKRKVYIIDEVHMLTPEAFNALLKTLEEPPEHAMFILATTEPHKLPATIISRCQRFDFRRVPLQDQIDQLRRICEQEGIEAEDEALRYLARLSDGGMRDALSLLDQVSTFSDMQITYDTALMITGGIPQEQFRKLAEAVLDQDIGSVLQIIEQFMQEGKSPDKCLENLLLYFRDLLVALMAPAASGLADRLQELEAHRGLAERFGRSRLFAIIEVLNHYQAEMKYAVQPQMILEVAVLKLCTDGTVPDETLENKSSKSESWQQEIGVLRNAIQKLQQELAQLREQGVAARSASDGQGDGQTTAGASGSSRASRSTSNGARSRTAGATGGASRSIRTTAQLEMFKQQPEPGMMDAVLAKWPSILQQVKDRKITVHAWLIDGEPVAATADSLLLVFKSAMHRETTDKPANRELIEFTISEVLGKPLKLMTAMRNEWDNLRSDDTPSRGDAATGKEPEVLQLTPDNEGQSSEANGEQDWIEEAIKMFGEDLVQIKDD